MTKHPLLWMSMTFVSVFVFFLVFQALVGAGAHGGIGWMIVDAACVGMVVSGSLWWNEHRRHRHPHRTP
jgi:hypothetical protein